MPRPSLLGTTSPSLPLCTLESLREPLGGRPREGTEGAAIVRWSTTRLSSNRGRRPPAEGGGAGAGGASSSLDESDSTGLGLWILERFSLYRSEWLRLEGARFITAGTPSGVGALAAATLFSTGSGFATGGTRLGTALFLEFGTRLGLVSFLEALDGHDRFTGSGCGLTGGSGSDFGGGGCCLPSLMVILPFCIWQGPSSSDRAAAVPVGIAGGRSGGDGLRGAGRAWLAGCTGLREELECTGERENMGAILAGERISARPSGLGLLSMCARSASLLLGYCERMGVKESSSTRESSALDWRPAMVASPPRPVAGEPRLSMKSASFQLWVSRLASGAEPSLSELSESLPEPEAEDESSESLELDSDDDIFSTRDGS